MIVESLRESDSTDAVEYLENAMATTTGASGKIRRETQFLIERLPDDATWDDVHYEVYVRQSIKAGYRRLRGRASFDHRRSPRAVGVETMNVVWSLTATCQLESINDY